MDKLIVDAKGMTMATLRSVLRWLIARPTGQVTISNDGATIMKLLDVVHPAAKTLVDIARSQDAEVSDFFSTMALDAPKWHHSLLIYLLLRLEMERPALSFSLVKCSRKSSLSSKRASLPKSPSRESERPRNW
jgi:hypothetical protein